MNRLHKIAPQKGASSIAASLRRSALLFSLSYLGTINNTMAHEFWLESVVPEGAMDGSIQVHMLYGQYFSGEALPYIPDMIDSFTIINAEERTPVVASMGDMSVVVDNLMLDGMHTLQYESAAHKLIHASVEKFEQYTVEEGVQQVLNEWQESSTHTGSVHESYRRYAKSLFSRGHATGSDSYSGMLLELVALDNPFKKVAGRPISVKLLYQGRPLVGAQVTVYIQSSKYAGLRRTFISNDEGVVHVPHSVNTRYLINAVHLRQSNLLDRFLDGSQFNSLWASLTFQTPAM